METAKTDGLKKIYKCPKCNGILDHRVRRSFIMKALMFWRPLKRFKCFNCQRNIYVLS